LTAAINVISPSFFLPWLTTPHLLFLFCYNYKHMQFW
jgi:hypothetical protein